MAILRLVVEGSLTPDAPVARWLPDLRRCAGDLGSTLLVRHLISHCSGLVGDWVLDRDPGIGDGPDSLIEQIRRIPELRFSLRRVSATPTATSESSSPDGCSRLSLDGATRSRCTSSSWIRWS